MGCRGQVGMIAVPILTLFVTSRGTKGDGYIRTAGTAYCHPDRGYPRGFRSLHGLSERTRVRR